MGVVHRRDGHKCGTDGNQQEAAERGVAVGRGVSTRNLTNVKTTQPQACGRR